VHVTAVQRAGLQSLSEGQRVTFDVVDDRKGKKAENLVLAK
jgi:CspA family cold shock protein